MDISRFDEEALKRCAPVEAHDLMVNLELEQLTPAAQIGLDISKSDASAAGGRRNLQEALLLRIS